MSKSAWNVIYPSEIEKQIQMEEILEQGLENKKLKRERIKGLLLGPGFSVIFYRAKLILLGSLFLYLILLFLGNYLEKFVANDEYVVIAVFPMLHLIFHIWSYWSEEQEEIIELKGSLYYSFQYLVGLRMFYVSIGSAMLNLLLMAGLAPFYQIGKVGMLGLSSLFLFAVLTLYLCEKTNGLRSIMISVAIWLLLCVSCAMYGEGLHIFLFEMIPWAVHVVILGLSFSLFMYYFGKVGMKYAYACEY